MKKLDLTKNDLLLLFLFTNGFILLFTGILLKNMLAVAGITGLLIAWFLSIDNVIANHKMHLVKLIFFSGIILFLPLFFAFYLGA